jgi:sulfatase modifying factor 1
LAEEAAMKNKSIVLGCAVLLSVLGMQVCAECPSGDVTGDCLVNLKDFAVIARQWLTGNGIPNDMVAIPGGSFIMGDSLNDGDSNQRPIHIVTLDPFYMGKYEVTNEQYSEFLGSTQPLVSADGVVYGRLDKWLNYPYFDTSIASSYSQIDFISGLPALHYQYPVRLKGRSDMSNDPVVMVSWYGAVAYCNWRSQQEGKQPCYNLTDWTCDFTKNGYRLPTEAEWEYAARGGLSGKRFPWGDTITHSQANYYSSSSYGYDTSPTRFYHPTWSSDEIKPYTSQVGSFSANGYRLYDMAGNVFEWCNDWCSSTYYSSSPTDNPTGPASGNIRVLRGGCWNYYNSAYYSVICRVSSRGNGTPDYRNYSYGFRLVLDLD